MISGDMRDRIFSNLKTLNAIFCDEGKKWSYYEAGKYVYLLVEYIQKKNIERIAVEASQCFYTYVLLIAAYLAKVTFCCYDPELPYNRKQEILNDYQPSVIIKIFPEAKIEEGIQPYSFIVFNNTRGNTKLKEQNIAYVLYTSGSTGRPKGVLIRYESLENVIIWGINSFGLTMKDICGQYAPLWFDMSMFDLFGAVTSGAQLIPFSTRNMKLIPGVVIKAKKISFWNSIPQAFLYIKARKQLNNEYLASLKKIKLGGDCVLRSLVEEIFLALPNTSLFITYGPTETTIFASCLPLHSSNFEEYYKFGSAPIGNAIVGMRISLGETQNGIGEIILEGENVASGYIGELMNDKFSIINRKNKKARIFHTGDLAYEYNGCYYFVGRYDSQVKISGKRFDLMEIEEILAKKDIISCCLLIHNQIALVFEKKSTFSIDFIKEYIKNYLPEYAYPKVIIAMDKIPINSNGKFDKNRIMKEIGYES